MDFWISDWISGFHSGFLDFWISVWISADGVRDFFRDGPLAADIEAQTPQRRGGTHISRGIINFTQNFEIFVPGEQIFRGSKYHVTGQWAVHITSSSDRGVGGHL